MRTEWDFVTTLERLIVAKRIDSELIATVNRIIHTSYALSGRMAGFCSKIQEYPHLQYNFGDYPPTFTMYEKSRGYGDAR